LTDKYQVHSAFEWNDALIVGIKSPLNEPSLFIFDKDRKI
jgi:hypothetical protein